MEKTKDQQLKQKQHLYKHLYIVKFAQPPFRDASTHWAIFLADESAGFDEDEIPYRGHLFHASKDCAACGISAIRGAKYLKFENFELSGHPKLRSTLSLDCLDGIT